MSAGCFGFCGGAGLLRSLLGRRWSARRGGSVVSLRPPHAFGAATTAAGVAARGGGVIVAAMREGPQRRGYDGPRGRRGDFRGGRGRQDESFDGERENARGRSRRSANSDFGSRGARDMGARRGSKANKFEGRKDLDEFGNTLPGRTLKFRRSDRPSDDHNVVVLGKIDSREEMKMCFGCGAYVGKFKVGGEISASTTESDRPYRMTTLDDMELCPRCQGLEDASFTEAREAIGNVDMRVFENQLKTLKWKKVLIVIVVDATDLRGSFISWRKMSTIVGSNPVFIAVTKCDLMPRVTDAMLKEWRMLAYKLYGENVMRVYPLSGLTGAGVFRLAKNLYKFVERGENNVYVIGQANIGKSTLARALADNFFRHIDFTDPRGWGRKKAFGRLMPTVSSLPGTTLMSIRLPCFDSPNHSVWDTPGLIPDPVPWLKNRLLLQHPTALAPVKYKVIEGTCLVIGNPGQQMVRIEIERTAPTIPVTDFRLAVWQAPPRLDIPIRILTTAEALAERDERFGPASAQKQLAAGSSADAQEPESGDESILERNERLDSLQDEVVEYDGQGEALASASYFENNADYNDSGDDFDDMMVLEDEEEERARPNYFDKKLPPLSRADLMKELTITPNTSFRPQDLVLGGLGWIAMNGLTAATVKIYVREDAGIQAELRDCLYDPYKKLSELRAMSPFTTNSKGNHEDADFEFTRQAAIQQEEAREMYMFNVDYHRKVDEAGKPVTKKELKDLWEGWVEGGIRDRKGQIKSQILH